MGQPQSHRGGEEDQNVDLYEFSVVLAATSNNPSILNPDFLFHNGIVDASCEVKDPRISTPAFSQVVFQNGLTVKADPDRVIFEQRGTRLGIEEIVCPDIAIRYLEKVPHVPYRAVGINPKARRPSEGKAADRVADALIDQGAWLSFKDCTPEIQLKAIYRYTNRTIIMDIAGTERMEQGEKQISGLLFEANIHRDIQAANPIRRIQTISSIFSLWREDLNDFFAIAAKFDSQK